MIFFERDQCMPKISVIVPVYNVAEYVKGCLESVIAQTEKDIEIICVDDGSTDLSRQIIDEMARQDKRIKVIHQKNQGVSVARNTGLDYATGEFISFCDSDDYFHPEFYEKCVKIINETNAEVVCGGIVPTRRKYPIAFQPLNDRKLHLTIVDQPFETYLTKSLIATNVNRHLYRRSAIGALRFVPGVRLMEDMLFITFLMQKVRKVAVTDYPIYYYYSNPHSVMRTSFTPDKVKNYIWVIRYLNERIQKENPACREAVRRYILNRRFKMMVNQAVRKQKNIEKRKVLFDLIQSETQKLYRENIISYDGLKLHHRVVLFLLLKMKTSVPARLWMTLV